MPVPEGDFRYTAGEDVVTAYNPLPEKIGTFYFCPKCGVRIGTAVNNPAKGVKRFNLSVPTLEDVPVEDLLAAPVRWVDGLNDRWTEEPEEVRHL